MATISIPNTTASTALSWPRISTGANPNGVTPDQLAWLKRVATFKPHEELQRIRDHYESTPDAIGPKYFVAPSAQSTALWRENRKLLTHVNLVLPSARTWTAAVYSGEATRDIVENPYYDLVSRWVDSVDYSQAVTTLNESAIVYGTACIAPRYERDEDELCTWLPDPVYTHYFVDELDVSKVLAVAEVKPGRVQFMATWGEGIITKSGCQFTPRDYGQLPIVIAYGVDRRHRGEIMGLSLVRAAVDWSIAATRVNFNVALLQKQHTKSIFVRIGQLSQLAERGGTLGQSGEGATMDLPEGFSAFFASPNPEIAASLEVLRSHISLLAMGSSIPADVLDATLTASVSSAEAARIRAIPLIQRARQLIPIWRAVESKIIVAATAAIEHELTGVPINLKAVGKRCVSTIRLVPQLIPMHPNELTQDLIAQVAFGFKRPETALRALDPMMDPEEVIELADGIRERMAKAGPGQQHAQQVLQATAIK